MNTAPRKMSSDVSWTGLESLETRLLLSAFANADFNGTFALQGAHDAGTVTMNGSGIITGASLTHEDGTTAILAGTYNVTPSGTFTVNLYDGVTPAYIATGAVNSTGDLVAENYVTLPDSTTNDAGLTFAIRHTLTFSNSDISGTWNIAAGDVRASIAFDGAGHITGGSYVGEDQPSGGKITGGTYSVTAGGTVTLNIQTNGPPDQQPGAMVGTIDNSKDVIVFDNNPLGPANPDYDPGDDAGLLLLVKRSGTYVAADFAGTWTLAGSDVRGTVTLNGAGVITGGTVTDYEGTNLTLSGTYTAKADGTVTVNITATETADPSQVDHIQFVGELNGSKNFVALTPSTFDHNDFLTLVRSASSAPTIDSLTSNSPVTRGSTLTLTAQNVAVPAGTITSVQFYVDTDGSGTFTTGDKRVGVGTQSGPNWTLGVDTLKSKLPLGSKLFFARATDSFKRVSNTVSTSVTVQNALPSIATLQVVTPHVAANNPLTLQATGVADPDGTVSTVNFYWDADSDGTPDVSELLGSGTSKSKWALTLPNAPAGLPGHAGTATFLARAVDNDGGLSAVKSATVSTVAQPTIANVTATPSPFVRTASGTLTANNVIDPDAGVVKVTFWAVPAGTALTSKTKALGLGTQAGADWALTIPQSKLVKVVPGTYTVYAQAVDANGILSDKFQIALTVV